MQWDVNIDICALILLGLVLLLHVSKQVVSIRRSRVFFAMVLLEAAAIICSVTIKYLLLYAGQEPGLWSIVLVDVFYVMQYLVPILYMDYMVVWSGHSMKSNRITEILFAIPIIAYLAIMVWNIATQGLYTWEMDFGYKNAHPAGSLLVIALYCIMYGVIYAVIYVRKLAFSKLSVIGLSAAGVVMVMLVQHYSPGISHINFIVAIAMLLLYLVAQNQSEMIDNNTQVLNRNMLDELLRDNISKRTRFDLVVLALDDFKFVNKTFGVTTGDMMLMQVAHFLTTITKKAKVYRYGADQFALEILHGDMSVEQVITLIQERFRHPWITEDVSVMLSTTISCVSYPDDGATMANVIDVIDYSILSAKTSGRGAVVYARDLDLHALRKEKAIEKAVEDAILQDTIEVYYQPIYNTEKQCYTSAEALVRLRDDMLGNIPPDVFIPIAERNGTIVKLGALIFEKVCQFIQRVNLRETSIEYIEVNVSVVQCMQQDFVEKLIATMERYEVRPDQINLEVTETAASNSLAILQENIERLHAKGISFSLDDYGSGYSTLGYIHQLPFKIIKLDRLMVWDAFANERAGITLKFTVGMLKELKVSIVAEGVETHEQQAHLTGIGCDYLQGWYYSKAIPANEFEDLIKKAS